LASFVAPLLLRLLYFRRPRDKSIVRRTSHLYHNNYLSATTMCSKQYLCSVDPA